MRESSEPLRPDAKPFPFLGAAPSRVAGGGPRYLIVKVALGPVSKLAERCLKEEEEWARTIGRLDSVGNEGRYRWVARTYIDGTPMNRLSADITDEQRARYGYWLLVEINNLHVKNLESHLDIKPSNVIITDERAVLIDFETSKDHGSETGFNGLATAPFASPEQLFARSDRAIEAPSDVFSWGLTVYSMFRDEHPYCSGSFDFATMAEIDERVAAGGQAPAPDLSAIQTTGLREAVAGALEWLPEKRPAIVELIRLMDRDDPSFIIKRLPLTEVQPPVIHSRPTVPLVTQIRWWLSPDGPLGDSHGEMSVHLTALVLAATLGLAAGLLLAVLVGGIIH